MVGNIIGHPDSMPQVYIEIDVKTTILKRVVGTRQDSNNRIEGIQEGEMLLINIGSTSCGGNVQRVNGVSISSV
jgi:translation initiation factor 2 subunit 3